MKPEDAAKKLSFHLMQCGMMMPMEWIRENGEGSELQQAFRMALDALGAIEYREYSCHNCGHTWMEDRDASDYPDYCPGCGEPLGRESNEPLTLERLREMDGEPVYVHNLFPAKRKFEWQWALVCKERGNAEATTYTYKFIDYRKTWLAYRRPPKG